jgi:hypothetical protein
MEMPLPKEHDTKTIHMPLEGASIGFVFFYPSELLFKLRNAIYRPPLRRLKGKKCLHVRKSQGVFGPNSISAN